MNGEGSQQISDQTNDPQTIEAAKSEEKTLDTKSKIKFLEIVFEKKVISLLKDHEKLFQSSFRIEVKS